MGLFDLTIEQHWGGRWVHREERKYKWVRKMPLNCSTITVLIIPDSQMLRKGAACHKPKMKPRMKPNTFTYAL